MLYRNIKSIDWLRKGCKLNQDLGDRDRLEELKMLLLWQLIDLDHSSSDSTKARSMQLNYSSTGEAISQNYLCKEADILYFETGLCDV